MGYVYPPSVDKRMSTFVALTGDAAVLATFHVIVLVSPAFHVDAVLNDVTVNAPEEALTVDTVILTSLLHPNTPVKSLATPLKLIDLATEGNTCHVFDVLLTILSNGGKYLDGEVVDSILLNTGPEELVDAGGMV